MTARKPLNPHEEHLLSLWKARKGMKTGQRLAEVVAEASKGPPFTPTPLGTPLDLSGYALTLLDEFDRPEVSRAQWEPLTGTPAHLGEKAVYDPARLTFEGGCAVLTADYVKTPVDGRNYITAGMRLKGSDGLLRRFLYGYHESTWHIDVGNGAHPADWFYDLPYADVKGDRGGSTEIDIMEYLGHWALRGDQYHTSAHLDLTGDKQDFGAQIAAPINGQTNTFGVKWLPDRLDYYLNRELVRSIPNPGCHIPMARILNLAIGSKWALQKFGGATGLLSPADFPMVCKIDRVASYHKPDAGGDVG